MRFVATILFVLLALPLRAQPNISSTALDFGTVVLKDSKVLSVTVKNIGTTPLYFKEWKGPWTPDFTVGAGFRNLLEPDSSESISIKFSPQSITANHQHVDSLHFIFPDLPDTITILLAGMDHVPINNIVEIADTFLTYPGRTITVPQYLTGSLDGALDSIYFFREVISWDPNVMDFKSALPGAMIQGWTISPTSTIQGQKTILATAFGHGILGAGELIRFEFEVLPTAPVISISSIKQESIVFGNGFEPLMSSIPGKVTVMDSCVPLASNKAGLGATMLQNAPNPFHDETLLTYQVGGECEYVSIRIFDCRGNLVATPLASVQRAGLHELRLHRKGLAAGVYTCVFEAADARETRKIVVAP